MEHGKRLPILFGLLCGFGMLAQWAMFILTGQVPELQTEPYRIAFHLAAEGITALGLIASSILLLQKKKVAKKLYTISSGMLLYSVIVSPGYFAQLGQWGFVVMFAVVLGLAILSLFQLHKIRNNKTDESA